MKKKLVGIFICTLVIMTTIIPIAGTISTNPDKNIDSCAIPSDTYFDKQWSLHNIGQGNPYSGNGTVDADIDAPNAWDIETGSAEIVIAIIDCGIDYTHPDLADNIWMNEDEIANNSIDDDSNGYVDDIRGWNFFDDNNDVLDYGGHGTAHAGVAAAVGNNAIGIAGVCWDCKIMPIHCVDEFDNGAADDIAAGIHYAVDNGADVISMSFGNYTPNSLVNDAVDYAYTMGVVLVAAAGNEGTSSEFYPAAYEHVIAVTATANNDSRMDVIRWGFVHGISNYGDWVDVAAPGVDIYVTLPTYEVTYNTLLGVSQNYDYMSGTSFSCPHVSGLAALLLSQNSDLTPDEIKNLICDEKNVDPYNSTYDLGSGRINAYKTLHALDGYPQLTITSVGGIGLKTVIKNTGENEASNINWSVTFEGGIIFPKEKTDIITRLSPDEEATIQVIVIGFGKTTIMISAICEEGMKVEDSVSGLVFLFFVLGLS